MILEGIVSCVRTLAFRIFPVFPRLQVALPAITNTPFTIINQREERRQGDLAKWLQESFLQFAAPKKRVGFERGLINSRRQSRSVVSDELRRTWRERRPSSSVRNAASSSCSTICAIAACCTTATTGNLENISLFGFLFTNTSNRCKLILHVLSIRRRQGCEHALHSTHRIAHDTGDRLTKESAQIGDLGDRVHDADVRQRQLVIGVVLHISLQVAARESVAIHVAHQGTHHGDESLRSRIQRRLVEERLVQQHLCDSVDLGLADGFVIDLDAVGEDGGEEGSKDVGSASGDELRGVLGADVDGEDGHHAENGLLHGARGSLLGLTVAEKTHAGEQHEDVDAVAEEGLQRGHRKVLQDVCEEFQSVDARGLALAEGAEDGEETLETVVDEEEIAVLLQVDLEEEDERGLVGLFGPDLFGEDDGEHGDEGLADACGLRVDHLRVRGEVSGRVQRPGRCRACTR